MRTADLESVLQVLADATVVADRGDAVVFVNAAAERLLGWTAADLVGKSLSTIMPERMRSAHTAGFRRYFDTHRPHIMGRPVRVPALRKDGVEIDVELTLAAVVDETGGERVVASLRDLRDRVELERQLDITRYMKASAGAAAQLTAVLDVTRVVKTAVTVLANDFDAALARVWLYRPETRTLHLSASAGLTDDIEHSRRARIDVDTYPFAVGHVARTSAAFVKNGLADDPQFEAEWVARQGIASVAVFPLLITGELRGVIASFHRRPLPEEVVGLLGTFSAIVATTVNDAQLFARETDARREAQAAAAEAREAVEARDAFLSIASHELRTPTTALALLVQSMERRLLGKSLRGPEVDLVAIQKIALQVRRLTVLINTLLDVSRITANRLQVDLEETDLTALVNEVSSRFTDELERTGCTLALSAEGPVIGLWDPFRLDQVLTNLVSNAIKYGRGRPIEIAVTQNGEHARVTVADHGIGIAPVDQKRIFERFERAVSERNYGGFGIGLWIARQIVNALGGEISVESVPGEGSKFTFELPLGPNRTG